MYVAQAVEVGNARSPALVHPFDPKSKRASSEFSRMRPVPAEVVYEEEAAYVV